MTSRAAGDGNKPMVALVRQTVQDGATSAWAPASAGERSLQLTCCLSPFDLLPACSWRLGGAKADSDSRSRPHAHNVPGRGNVAVWLSRAASRLRADI
jgi:hypothetical protein